MYTYTLGNGATGAQPLCKPAHMQELPLKSPLHKFIGMDLQISPTELAAAVEINLFEDASIDLADCAEQLWGEVDFRDGTAESFQGCSCCGFLKIPSCRRMGLLPSGLLLCCLCLDNTKCLELKEEVKTQAASTYEVHIGGYLEAEAMAIKNTEQEAWKAAGWW